MATIGTVVTFVIQAGDGFIETQDPSEAFFWQCLGYTVTLVWISSVVEWADREHLL